MTPRPPVRRSISGYPDVDSVARAVIGSRHTTLMFSETVASCARFARGVTTYCSNLRWSRQMLAHAQARICSSCGQPVIPTGIRLPRIKREIFEAVRRRPNITAAALRDVVWGADPNGGPESRTILHVHVSQLNRLLAPYGIEIRSAGGGYSIRAVS